MNSTELRTQEHQQMNESMNIRSINSLKGILVGALLALWLSSAHADDPVILTQPTNQSILVGDNASFSVTVSNYSPTVSGIPGANGPVYATVVDASGNLYIGGEFTAVGAVNAKNIAKWDGTNWFALGSGIAGSIYRPHVATLALLNGELYAGGIFLTAGGITANHIAKWNGTNWSAVGSGMNNGVYMLAAAGSDLYAGGDFTTAGGSSANHIAKWNGTGWSALGAGMNSVVSALAMLGSDLYAGGTFTNAGGIVANGIAKWNGSSWSALTPGLVKKDSSSTLYVSSLSVSGSDLYVGGSFRTAVGTITNVAKWNGSSWFDLGWRDEDVWMLAASGTDLYVIGDFWTAGGIAVNLIARWNGTSWSALHSGITGAFGGWDYPYLRTLATSGNDVYVGGSFLRAGDYAANCIAKWNGDDWVALVFPPPAFTFQWQFNGVNLTNGGGISGAHLPTLTMKNAQVSQAGNYRVAVSSTNSTVFSSSALLSVSTNTLANALDTEGTAFVWGSTAPWPWFSQSAVTHDGVDAARTGPVADMSGSSGLSTTVPGPGILTFWGKGRAKPP